MNFTRISMQDWQAEGEKRSDSQSLVTLKDLKEEFENYPRLKNFEKSVTEHTEAILANVQSKEEELHLKFTKLLNMEKMLNNKLEEFQHQVKVKEKELLQLEKKLKEDFDDKVKVRKMNFHAFFIIVWYNKSTVKRLPIHSMKIILFDSEFTFFYRRKPK